MPIRVIGKTQAKVLTDKRGGNSCCIEWQEYNTCADKRVYIYVAMVYGGQRKTT